jgi:hypothetical protein
VAEEARLGDALAQALKEVSETRVVGDLVEQARLAETITRAAEDVGAARQAGEARPTLTQATERLVAETADAEARFAQANEVRTAGLRPWEPCADPVQAANVEAQLLSEAQSFNWQSTYAELPVDSFTHVRTVITPENLLLVSEKLQTECSLSVAKTEVQFYRSSLTDKARIDARAGDVITYHTHPGVNEEMKFTPTQGQELLDLLNQGDKKGFLTRIADSYQAEGLDIHGTLLEDNMRNQGMIP